MNPRPHHSSFGSVAAILLSLISCAGGRAQDFPGQQPRGAGSETTTTPHLATCSPDGEFFAVASPDGRIKCGRTQEGAAKRTFHQCRPSALLFSPDSRFLAGVGASSGCRAGLKVWNVEKGTELCRLETELGSNPLLSFSPDSLRLVTSGEGFTVTLWDLTTGKRIWSVSVSRPIARLAFSKESQAVVAVSADGDIQRF